MCSKNRLCVILCLIFFVTVISLQTLPSLIDNYRPKLINISPEEIAQAAASWRKKYILKNSDSIGIQKCQVFTDPKMALIAPQLARRQLPGIIFIVNSASGNFEQRSRVRFMFDLLAELLDSEQGLNTVFSAVFVVGSTKDVAVATRLIEEAETNQDILMCHIEDSYQTLTLKTFFSAQVVTFDR